MLRLTRWITPFVLLIFLVACGKGQAKIEPPEIRYGETECTECRMIISDPRFAAAYTYETTGGRYESVAFDDIGDMLIHADKHPEHQIVAYWVHDFDTQEWLDAQDAYFMFSHHLQTPMAQGTAALTNRERAEELAVEYQGQVLGWSGLLAEHHAGNASTALTTGASTALTKDLAVTLGGAEMHAHSHDTLHVHDDETLMMLGEAEAAGYHLRLLSHGPLHAGYNNLMLQLVNPAGETMTQADVTLHPLMHMPKMDHAAPVEQPDAQAHIDRHFGGAVGFPMPSGPDLGSWELGVTFSDPASDVQGEATFPIEVAPSRLSGSFVATDDESKLFLMVVAPQEASVGLQPIEILAVQKKSAMEWPPVDDLTLEIIPEMPTMGHGSLNNENPTSIGDGHYRGQINFSMAGPWTVTVKVSRGGTKIGEIAFEYDIK